MVKKTKDSTINNKTKQKKRANVTRKVAKSKSSNRTTNKYKITIIKDRCKGCKLCVSYCPMGTLEMSDEMNEKGFNIPRVVSLDTCKGCELCSKYCPDFAIFCECIDNKKVVGDTKKRK